jgi:hypothetical protein
MPDGDFANFRAVYDELTDEVNRARYQFLPDHIGNWFKTLDTTPRISAIIDRLEKGVDYRTWRHALTRAVQNPRIEFPAETEQSLGIKLQLFRNFTVGAPDDFATFGFAFMRTGKNVNDNAHAVVEQIFMPMARELRRYLQQEFEKVPASDRIVTLDHNSDPYARVMEALAEFKKALRDTNLYSDPEEKERNIAEVTATQELLKPNRVNATTVMTIITGVAAHIAIHFSDTILDLLSHNVLDALKGLLGF